MGETPEKQAAEVKTPAEIQKQPTPVTRLHAAALATALGVAALTAPASAAAQETLPVAEKAAQAAVASQEKKVAAKKVTPETLAPKNILQIGVSKSPISDIWGFSAGYGRKLNHTLWATVDLSAEVGKTTSNLKIKESKDASTQRDNKNQKALETKTPTQEKKVEPVNAGAVTVGVEAKWHVAGPLEVGFGAGIGAGLLSHHGEPIQLAFTGEGKASLGVHIPRTHWEVGAVGKGVVTYGTDEKKVTATPYFGLNAGYNF